jgi:hypothetical protein
MVMRQPCHANASALPLPMPGLSGGQQIKQSRSGTTFGVRVKTIRTYAGAKCFFEFLL